MIFFNMNLGELRDIGSVGWFSADEFLKVGYDFFPKREGGIRHYGGYLRVPHNYQKDKSSSGIQKSTPKVSSSRNFCVV